MYLLNCVNEKWIISVTYFLVNGLNSQERASVTTQVLDFLKPSGIKIICITFDGHAANIRMSRQLGAHLFNRHAFFVYKTGAKIRLF